jgi:hypothetical protein
MGLELGDIVTLEATVRAIVQDRASLSIPSFNFPFSIPLPPRKKKVDVIELSGEVVRIDGDHVTVELDGGGLVTVEARAIAASRRGAKPKLRDCED